MISDIIIERMKREILLYRLALKIANRYKDLLSESVMFSPAVYLTISVYSRTDLQLLMQLAPIWKKESFPEGLYYKATVEGQEVTLIAFSGALPSTCKMVDEVVVLPAEPAKPERRVTKKVLKCDLPHEQTIQTPPRL